MPDPILAVRESLNRPSIVSVLDILSDPVKLLKTFNECWQEHGRCWLSRSTAEELLRQSQVFKETKRFAVSRATMRFLHKIWRRKGDTPQLTCRKGRHRWFSSDGLAALIRWHAMPKGYYGDPADPSLDIFASAEYLGCDPASINNWWESGRLQIERQLSREGHGYLKTSRLSVLNEAKTERGFQIEGERSFRSDNGLMIPLGEAAETHRIPLHRLRKEVKGSGMFPEIALDMEVRPVAQGGRVKIVLDPQVNELKQAIRGVIKRGKPKGFATASELVAVLKIADRNEELELAECLSFWRRTKRPGTDIYWVKSDHSRFQAKRIRDGEETAYLVKEYTYDIEQVRKLWSENHLNEAAKELNKLVAKGSVLAIPARQRLTELGIPPRGRRLARVRDLAGVRPRCICTGRVGEVNSYWIYERVNAQTNPIDVVRNVFVDGWAKIKESMRRFREEGLSQKQIYRSINELRAQRTRIRIPGPWYWRLPESSDSPPKLEKLTKTMPGAASTNPPSARGVGVKTEELLPNPPHPVTVEDVSEKALDKITKSISMALLTDSRDGPIDSGKFRLNGVIVEDLQLTPTEYHLLKYLCDKSPTISFEDARERIWTNGDSGDGAIKTAVSRLTIKLADHGIKWKITTKIGFITLTR